MDRVLAKTSVWIVFVPEHWNRRVSVGAKRSRRRRLLESGRIRMPVGAGLIVVCSLTSRPVLALGSERVPAKSRFRPGGADADLRGKRRHGRLSEYIPPAQQ